MVGGFLPLLTESTLCCVKLRVTKLRYSLLPIHKIVSSNELEAISAPAKKFRGPHGTICNIQAAGNFIPSLQILLNWNRGTTETYSIFFRNANFYISDII